MMACCHCGFWLSVCMLAVSFTIAGADQACKNSQSDSDGQVLLQVSDRVKQEKYRKVEPGSTHKSLNRNPFEEVYPERMSHFEIEAAVQQMQAPGQEARKVHERVNLYQKASLEDQPHTKVECIGPKYNVTCKFQNLYFEYGQFKAYFPQGFKPPEEMEFLMPIHRYGGRDPPVVTTGKRTPLSVDKIIPGTTLYYHTIWHHNIGHFLWDGLYPSYVALTQWGHTGKDFNSVAVFDENCFQAGAPNGRCISEDIMRKIGGETGKFFTKLELQKMPGTLRFEEFIMGAGHKGARSLNRDFAAWGQRDLDALRSFRDRLYHVYGLDPPPRRNSSLQNRQSKQLKAIVIDNKRYSLSEINDLKAAAKEISGDVHAEYINYMDTASDFGKQLKLLQDADIHVSGPGTGMAYLDFMPDGSVHVALGMEGAWPWNDRERPYNESDVSFMEEYWAEGNTHLRALPYPIKEHRKEGGLTKPRIKSMIGDAAALIRSDYTMPVEPGVNLSPVGQTFKEYCYTIDEKECETLLQTMNGDIAGAECDAWPDGIVWEAGGYSENGYQGTHCKIDRKVLRAIRQKHLAI